MFKRFIKGSIAMLTATAIANVFAYLFQFYAARALGPAQYGILGAVLSMFLMLSVSLQPIATAIARFISEFKSRDQYGKIAFLLIASMKRVLCLGFAIGITVFLSSWCIADFLNIPSNVSIALVGGWILSHASFCTSRGTLLGLQRFKALGFAISLEAILRFLLGLGLVSLGLGANGAILAYLLASFISFLVAWYPLRFLLSQAAIQVEMSGVYGYVFPVLATSVAIAFMVNVDLVVVKHFFSAREAGIYAALAALGRGMIALSGAFYWVMFPMVSEFHAKGQETGTLLGRAIAIISVLCGAIILAGWLFPIPIINIAFGAEYLPAAPLLWRYWAAVSLLILVNSYAMYSLARDDTRFIKVLLLAAGLQAVLLALFHQTLLQVVLVLIITNVTLLALLAFQALGYRPLKPLLLGFFRAHFKL